VQAGYSLNLVTVYQIDRVTGSGTGAKTEVITQEFSTDNQNIDALVKDMMLTVKPEYLIDTPGAGGSGGISQILTEYLKTPEFTTFLSTTSKEAQNEMRKMIEMLIKGMGG